MPQVTVKGALNKLKQTETLVSVCEGFYTCSESYLNRNSVKHDIKYNIVYKSMKKLTLELIKTKLN